MGGNTFGRIFRLTSFGESHGMAVGGVIDGCPANLDVSYDLINHELSRRAPGQSGITTQRNESDKVEFLSGIFEGKTLGTPVGFIVWNADKRPEDYEDIKNIFRPSHADYSYFIKYGTYDYRGGGRASARESVARIIAGAFARMVLVGTGVKISAYVSQVGNIKLEKNYNELDLSKIDDSICRCPDDDASVMMHQLIEQYQKKGNSVGGKVTCVIRNAPAGLGEPVFDKLHADLGKAMLSINGAKGFEYGSGFSCAGMTGSEHNDSLYYNGEKLQTTSNNSGGIQGGISIGTDIYFNIAFKPVSSIFMPQSTVDLDMNPVTFTTKGRHDVCIAPRAVPIVEAMAAMVLADFYLMNRMMRI
jgi:chorismate synthase